MTTDEIVKEYATITVGRSTDELSTVWTAVLVGRVRDLPAPLQRAASALEDLRRDVGEASRLRKDAVAKNVEEAA